ncbi:MAG: DNA-directed RNA polymerase subunit alpha [bacterium]
MKEIEKPTIKIVEEPITDSGICYYGKYLIQPLLRGFGVTLGNSLRRMLMSSIPGAAPVYIKIDGVLHEFSVIDGMVEDVTDIVINVKGIPIACNSDELVPVYIDVKGPCEITAGDIQADDRVEIVDPTYHIATLTGSTHLKMELGLKRGRGYVPTEWHEQDPDIPSGRGIILIDSDFSPIKKARFTVESARVGQRTDYDSLFIEVETNGTVSPSNSISEAAKLLIRECSFVVDFKEKILLEEKKKEEDKSKKDQNLKRMVDELDLSVRSYNCLKNADINTVEELVKCTESQLKGLRNFGDKSLREIKAKLSALGLSLKEEPME